LKRLCSEDHWTFFAAAVEAINQGNKEVLKIIVDLK
jgi:hypothetical protein